MLTKDEMRCDAADGKVAVITGASRGIGLAVAQRLVEDGYRVCVTARNAGPLAEVVARLGADRAIACAGSADDGDHQAEALSRTLDRFGRIDLLVNNTGINPLFGPVLEGEPDKARAIFETNVLAAIAWIRSLHAAWMAEHGGCVVNVASLAGLSAANGLGIYGASKAALLHLTRQLALELAPTVRVNAVAPAVVRTRFAGPLFEDRPEEVADSYPLRRIGEPEDVAAAVAYLASDSASWITGQTLVLDGGLSLTGGL